MRSLVRPLAVAAAVLSLGMPVRADESPSAGNPQTNASDRNADVNQPNTIGGGMQKTEDVGNRALNKLDNGVHKVAHKSKRAGHKAKKKAGDAAQDVKDDVNDRKEPVQQ